MEINDGGPAFPNEEKMGANGMRIDASRGMSLRDYFAGQALMGAMAYSFGLEDNSHRIKAVVCKCYQYADAMIAARKENSHAE